MGPVVVEEEVLGPVLQLSHLHLLCFEIAMPVLPLIHQVCQLFELLCERDCVCLQALAYEI